MTVPANIPAPMMAIGSVFPEVVSRDTSVEGTDTTSHLVDMPATVDAGDLLVIIFANDGNVNVTFDTFDKILDKNTALGDANLSVAYKQADGTEDGGTETVTTSSAESSAHIVYRITGHIDPVTQAPEVSTGAAGISANPNPDSLAPTGGSKKYLWLAVAANDGSDTTTNFPTNYVNGTSVTSGGGDLRCNAMGAERQLIGSSENPGAFTIDGSEEWAAATIAIHPA